MKLYYKEYDKNEVEIPSNSIILGDSDLNSLKYYETYPKPFCWEVDIINKIAVNEEGYFDFSKNLVDIGACLGEYCWLLHFNHAYAFEPNKESLFRMHTNILLHDKVAKCDTFQTILSDKIEDVLFDGFSNMDFVDKSKQYIVKSSTLDSYQIDNIGLIKVDVEGMEEKVLRGGLGTIIRSNYPPILFELWNVGAYGMTQEKHDSMKNFIEGLGYKILWYWGDSETHLAIHK